MKHSMVAQLVHLHSYTHRVTRRLQHCQVQIGPFPEDELPQIIENRPVALLPGVAKLGDARIAAHAKALGRVYFALRGTASSITMREVVKWVRRVQALDIPMALAGWSLLSSRLSPDSADYKRLHSVITTAWPGAGSLHLGEPSVKQVGGAVRFKEGGIFVNVLGAKLDRSPLFRNGPFPRYCG